MPMQTVTLKAIKRGDGFRRAAVYKTGATVATLVATSLAGFDTIRGQIRDSEGNLLGNLKITPAPDQEENPGLMVIEANPNPPDPAWPVDLLAFDLEFVAAGIPRSSWTILLPVEADETRDD